MAIRNFQSGNDPFGENTPTHLLSKDPLESLGVKRVGTVDPRLYVIPIPKILYAFKGNAAKTGMVNIPKFHPAIFKPKGIYIRTSKSVFLTSHRSFGALRQTLDSSSFAQSHQKFLVNLRRVGWLETRNKTGRLAIIHDDGIPEQIPLTRRHKPKILAALRVPSRQPPKESGTDDGGRLE